MIQIFNKNENAGAAVAKATHGVRRASKASDIRSLDKNRLQLFLCLLASALCLLASGCSVTRGTRHPDGSLTVTNYRLLWSSENVNFSTHSAGFNASLKIGKSATDDAAVAAVVSGIVKRLTRP